MMFVDKLATAADVTRLLGQIDRLTVAKVLAVAPTRDELVEAVSVVENDHEKEPCTPSEQRIECVRGILEALLHDDRHTCQTSGAQRPSPNG